MTITLLDGSIGQELVTRSSAAPTGLWSTKALLEEPELVRAVHRDYFAVGADIATTNSYPLLRDRLRPFGIDEQFTELHRQACRIAVEARDEHGAGLVAGAMGPSGWSYRPDLAPPTEQAAEIYAEIAHLQAPYVDLFLLETMSSVEQARGAVMGAAAGDKPIWLAISVDDADGTKFRSGEPLIDVAPLLTEFKIDALLVNCSIPEAISQAVPLLADLGVPIGGYANGFTKITEAFKNKSSSVDLLEKREDLDPMAYADFVASWIDAGATIVGGCCEVGPAHIEEMARRFK